MIITRLAPSPTGYIHLGNAWSFLITWLAARKANGKLLLRIDDLDPLRSKREFIEGIFRDLEWLGIDWDEEPVFQSRRFEFYEESLRMLQRKKLIYPCFCTRAELRRVASAPHADDEGRPYPGICSNLSADRVAQLIDQGSKYALRVRMTEENIQFTDLIQGVQNFDALHNGGDFPIRRSDGVWAYHLASSLDDALMNVNLVIRGRDILESTTRHIFLATQMGYSLPKYAHLPLILDQCGERLAKRHNALSLASLRDHSILPGQIIGALAHLGGFHPSAAPCMPGELLPAFDLSAIPRSNIQLPQLFA